MWQGWGWRPCLRGGLGEGFDGSRCRSETVETEGQVTEAGKQFEHHCTLLLAAEPPDQCSARLCGKSPALKEQKCFKKPFANSLVKQKKIEISDLF